MVSALTKDGSILYVALSDRELADLQRGDVLEIQGDLLNLPYRILLVPRRSADDTPGKTLNIPGVQAWRYRKNTSRPSPGEPRYAVRARQYRP